MKRLLFILLNFYSLIGFTTPFKGYIVKLKETALHENKVRTLSFLSIYGESKQIIKTSFGSFAHIQTKNPLSEIQLHALSQNSEVEYVEPNYIIKLNFSKNKMQLAEIDSPSDKDFSRQWALHNDGTYQSNEYSSIANEDLNMLNAWSITKGSKSDPIKIAVVDTGIDYNHPDLKNQMSVNLSEFNGKTGIDDDGNGFIDDIYGYDFANNDGDPMDGGGHGTHCAGIIGAAHNGIGTVGVMANVKLVALKFLTDEGEGEEINAIRAIDYAIKNGVRVLSNSWGGNDNIKALKDAIIGANNAGLSFVAAAGNDSADNDTTESYPSNFDVENVIAVGSYNPSGNISDFSNYGIKKVHLMAPGTDIFSTYKNGKYRLLSGTSMATPFVTGVIGLILTQWPDLTPVQIREHLIASSKKTTALSESSVSGGRVDAYNALILTPRSLSDMSSR